MVKITKIGPCLQVFFENILGGWIKTEAGSEANPPLVSGRNVMRNPAMTLTTPNTAMGTVG